MNPPINLAGFDCESPIIMNAAGTCKSLAHVKEFAKSDVSAIVYGSITYPPRPENRGSVYYRGPGFSLNSRGMPNEGGEPHRKSLPEMAAIAHNAGKLFIVSVAGDTPDEYAVLTEIGFEAGADIVEHNWGCPNKWDGATQGQIPAYDSQLGIEILTRTESRLGNRIKLLVKLSWLDPFSIRRYAQQVIIPFKSARGVTVINTLANALSYNDFGHTRITPGGGLAGCAGPAILPIALGQAKQWRDALPPHIAVIGVGGISQEKDVADYVDRAGVTAVQIGTSFLGHSLQERNYSIFSALKGGYRFRHRDL
ncbi:MAG: dihydroorotate dehydrogenase [Candidatus Sungbacteria bacterium]|uniref:Dihydroorotate dehydrogenase n=1 Tax=Candidatus Sungiibacteriota bacterium TaxID=2750080 RepID=A0A932QXS4_9BACT|nr:dihydroorotate dehydrogenase [Candidatus Sungbacteria bacterium]